MPELTYSEDCRTYRPVYCYICNNLTLPDDQETILTAKKYVCVCILCALALRKSD